MKRLEKVVGFIFNGNTEEDEEGEYTFSGGEKGAVGTYVIADDEIRDNVNKLEVGDYIDWDHCPKIVTLNGEKR